MPASRRRPSRNTAQRELAPLSQLGVGAAGGMEPEQLALVIDALGAGLMTAHLLHGPRAVTPDLFSKTLALLVDGIAARAGASAQPQEA